MKTTARQFFDIWIECVNGVDAARDFADALSTTFREVAVSRIRGRHGSTVAIEALAYFERLRADTQAGISSI